MRGRRIIQGNWKWKRFKVRKNHPSGCPVTVSTYNGGSCWHPCVSLSQPLSHFGLALNLISNTMNAWQLNTQCVLVSLSLSLSFIPSCSSLVASTGANCHTWPSLSLSLSLSLALSLFASLCPVRVCTLSCPYLLDDPRTRSLGRPESKMNLRLSVTASNFLFSPL